MCTQSRLLSSITGSLSAHPFARCLTVQLENGPLGLCQAEALGQHRPGELSCCENGAGKPEARPARAASQRGSQVPTFQSRDPKQQAVTRPQVLRHKQPDREGCEKCRFTHLEKTSRALLPTPLKLAPARLRAKADQTHDLTACGGTARVIRSPSPAPAACTAGVPHVRIRLPRLPPLSLAGSPAEPPGAQLTPGTPKTHARFPLPPAQRGAQLCAVTHSYQGPPCSPLPRSPRGFQPERLRIYSTSCHWDQERKTLCAIERTTGVYARACFISGKMVTSGKKSNRRGEQESAGSHESARHLPPRPRNRVAHRC